MKTSAYSCTCGRHKQEANRWIVGMMTNKMILAGDGYDRRYIAGLAPWNDGLANLSGALHFCSDQCAYKWLASELERLGR